VSDISNVGSPAGQQELAEYVDGLPNLSGAEELISTTIADAAARAVFANPGTEDPFAGIQSACAIALHMHQPLIPAGGDDLRTAALISNLRYMTEHPDLGDNHNASVFRWCYKRMSEFIPRLVDEGAQPRVMLEYSGTLLHGLREMGAHDVLDALRTITLEPRYRGAVEWLGCPWGHAVAPSTPVQDYRLHVRAWQQHFAALFGLEALTRVRGFSPSEMALPNHPDVAYECVRTLKDGGYRWVLVQEHTVERPNGGGVRHRHLPHRLVCTSSRGDTASIVALVKTQGSDTKLVAQMQPYYEARGLERCELAGRSVPPLVTQIADGENGGVMMNEFPPKYLDVMRECSGSATPILNGTEYLERLFATGVTESDLPVAQPLLQHRIWERMSPGDGPERLAAVIEELRREDGRFHMDGGSWTNDISWVRGYDELLIPMDRASAAFHERILARNIATTEPGYRNALFHLLTAETSCYRYWGQGQWTDYGAELARRTTKIIATDL
jgi:glycosyl hydrolase family 57